MLNQTVDRIHVAFKGGKVQGCKLISFSPLVDPGFDLFVCRMLKLFGQVYQSLYFSSNATENSMMHKSESFLVSLLHNCERTQAHLIE